MPTADVFDMVACALDAQAEQIDIVMIPVWPMVSGEVMAGGRLRDDLEQRLGDDADWLATDARQLRDAAATCRHRAEVCRQAEAAAAAYGVALDRYDDRMRSWRWADEVGLATGPRPVRPAPPIRPPSWVVLR